MKVQDYTKLAVENFDFQSPGAFYGAAAGRWLFLPPPPQDWIKTVLDQLKKEGRLKLSGRGRNARWRKAEMGE
jgi:hypothetical protein